MGYPIVVAFTFCTHICYDCSFVIHIHIQYFLHFFWATGAMNCTECAFFLLLYSLICVWTLSSWRYDRYCEFIVPIRKMESSRGVWQGKCKHSKFITTRTTMRETVLHCISCANPQNCSR